MRYALIDAKRSGLLPSTNQTQGRTYKWLAVSALVLTVLLIAP